MAGTDAAPPIAELMAKLPELVNGDPALQLRGRYIQAELMIEIGGTPYYLTVADGRVTRCDRGPLIMRAWAFALRGTEAVWREFWQPVPRPLSHDIFALAKRGELRIDGDVRPLMIGLLYFKGLLAAPRRLQEAPPLRPMEAR
jgi:hypothetical protein